MIQPPFSIQERVRSSSTLESEVLVEDNQSSLTTNDSGGNDRNPNSPTLSLHDSNRSFNQPCNPPGHRNDGYKSRSLTHSDTTSSSSAVPTNPVFHSSSHRPRPPSGPSPRVQKQGHKPASVANQAKSNAALLESPQFCDRCKKVFKNWKALKCHIEQRCELAQVYICRHCNFRTPRRYRAIKHHKDQHSDSRSDDYCPDFKHCGTVRPETILAHYALGCSRCGHCFFRNLRGYIHHWKYFDCFKYEDDDDVQRLKGLLEQPVVKTFRDTELIPQLGGYDQLTKFLLWCLEEGQSRSLVAQLKERNAVDYDCIPETAKIRAVLEGWPVQKNLHEHASDAIEGLRYLLGNFMSRDAHTQQSPVAGPSHKPAVQLPTSQSFWVSQPNCLQTASFAETGQSGTQRLYHPLEAPSAASSAHRLMLGTHIAQAAGSEYIDQTLEQPNNSDDDHDYLPWHQNLQGEPYDYERNRNDHFPFLLYPSPLPTSPYLGDYDFGTLNGDDETSSIGNVITGSNSHSIGTSLPSVAAMHYEQLIDNNHAFGATTLPESEIENADNFSSGGQFHDDQLRSSVLRNQGSLPTREELVASLTQDSNHFVNPGHVFRGEGTWSWLDDQDRQDAVNRGYPTPIEVTIARSQGHLNMTSGPTVIFTPDQSFLDPYLQPTGGGQWAYFTEGLGSSQELAWINFGSQDDFPDQPQPTAQQIWDLRQRYQYEVAIGIRLEDPTSEINLVWEPEPAKMEQEEPDFSLIEDIV